MKQFLYTLFLCIMISIPTGYARVVISSFLPDPEGADTGKEWVEITNSGATLANISGWQIDADALPYFTFPEGSLLRARETLRIFLRSDGQSGSGNLFTGSSFGSSNMRNSQGSIALFDSVGEIEDFVQYGTGGQMHEDTAVEVQIWNKDCTLDILTQPIDAIDTPCRIEKNAIDAGDSGAVMQEEDTTMTVDIDTCVSSGDETVLFISEIFPNPEGIDDDKEWVEIYNPTSEIIVICSLWLDDMEGGSSPQDLEGTLLKPHEYYVLEADQLKITMNNAEDKVRLLFGMNQEVQDEISYVDAQEGMTLSRVQR